MNKEPDCNICANKYHCNICENKEYWAGEECFVWQDGKKFCGGCCNYNSCKYPFKDT